MNNTNLALLLLVGLWLHHIDSMAIGKELRRVVPDIANMCCLRITRDWIRIEITCHAALGDARNVELGDLGPDKNCLSSF